MDAWDTPQAPALGACIWPPNAGERLIDRGAIPQGGGRNRLAPRLPEGGRLNWGHPLLPRPLAYGPPQLDSPLVSRAAVALVQGFGRLNIRSTVDRSRRAVVGLPGPD